MYKNSLINYNIGKYIRKKRKQSGYKNRENFAERVGISASALKKIECGESEPKIETLSLIAYYLGINIEEILKHIESEEELEFLELVDNLNIELNKRNYDNLNQYKVELMELSNDFDIESEREQFVNKCKLAICWIESIELCVKQNDYNSGYKLIEEQLGLRGLRFQKDYEIISAFNDFELLVFNSFVTMALKLEIKLDYEIIYRSLMNKERLHDSYRQMIYSRIGYNLCAVFLERNMYDRVKVEAKQLIKQMNEKNIVNDKAQFMLMIAVARYNLGECNTNKEVVLALNVFIVENKVQMLRAVMKNLEHYNVVLTEGEIGEINSELEYF